LFEGLWELSADFSKATPGQQDSQTWARLQDALARADSTTALGELDHLLTLSPRETHPSQWTQYALVALEFDDLDRAVRLYESALKCLTRPQLQEAIYHKMALEWLYLQALMGENAQRLANIFEALKSAPYAAEDEHVQSLGGLLSIALSVGRRQSAQAVYAAAIWWERVTAQQLPHNPFIEALKPYTYLLLIRLWESTGDVALSAEALARLLALPRIPRSLWEATGVYACLFNQVSTWYERIGIHLDWAFSDRSTLTLDILHHIVDEWPANIPDEDLRPSLQLTWEGLKAPHTKIELLQQAVSIRPTNLLAAEALLRNSKIAVETVNLHRAQWLISQSKAFGPLLSTHICDLTSGSRTAFSFVALNGGDGVGGSCYLANIGGKSLLLDAGLDVHTEPRSSYARLRQRIEDAGLVEQFADIDTVVVSHAHLDHVGLLPALQRDLEQMRRAQKRNPVYFYASPATRALARVMLEDAARIAQHNPSAALYSVETAIQATDHLVEPIDELLDPFLPDEGRISWMESGHILGSKMILIERQGFRLLYTGDFNPGRQLTIHPAATLSGLCPDVLVMESTYGYRTEPVIDRAVQEKLLTERLDAVLRRGGIVLFPAFAVGRSQEVLGLVARHAVQNPDLSYHIYVDGLSRAVTSLYNQWRTQLSSEYVRLVQQTEHRVRMVTEETDRETLIPTELRSGPAVVISSSGMLKQGSASHFYAQRLGQDRRNAIFFTGHLPDDSDGYAFLQAHTVADQINAVCEVVHFSLTAHASKMDLVRFVLDVAPRVVILVHGDAKLMKDDPHSVFQCLTALDQEKIQVFIGKNGRTIAMRDGRYVQI
jgi:Cft2 family RNA processing exonuclease/tetratricopeptide (TPR) repeat protein